MVANVSSIKECRSCAVENKFVLTKLKDNIEANTLVVASLRNCTTNRQVLQKKVGSCPALLFYLFGLSIVARIIMGGIPASHHNKISQSNDAERVQRNVTRVISKGLLNLSCIDLDPDHSKA